MTAYTVSAQPQALYPDGQQQEFAITNNGPWTVLIDNVSSIGVGSYALPPLSTMTWDASQPLWIAAKPPPDIARDSETLGYVNATVVITGNSDSVHAPRGQASVKLADVSKSDWSFQNHFYPIETEAFSSLIIDYNTILQGSYGAGTPPTTTFLATDIFWYTSDGDLSYHDRYYHPMQGESGDDYGSMLQRLTTAVKDSYAVIHINDTLTGQTYPLAARVYGQLRTLPESFHYWVSDTDSISPFNIFPGLIGISPDIEQSSDSAIVPTWSNGAAPADLWLSPIKPKLLIRLRATAITVAANLTVYAARHGNTVQLATVTIPVAGGTNWFELNLSYVPIGELLKIRCTAATGTTGLFLVWQD